MATIDAMQEFNEIARKQDADNTTDDPRFRAPLVVGGLDFAGVTDAVAGVAEGKMPPAWYIALAISLSLLGLLAYASAICSSPALACGATISRSAGDSVL